MQPDISIILPVYNGEKTIMRCLDSVVKQTFASWECIIINDGSTDDTGELLEAYARAHAGVKIITSANGGVSKAQNLGLKIACGNAITFLDADDVLAPEALETLWHLLTTTQADMAVGHLLFEDSQGIPVANTPPLPTGGHIQLFTPEGAACTIFRGNPFAGHLHGKLLRAELLCGLLYRDDLFIYEDMLFALSYLCHVSRVAYLPQIVHHYTIHEFGALAAPLSSRKASSLAACDALCAIAQAHFPSALPLAQRFAAQNALWFLQDFMALSPACQKEPWAVEARKTACRLLRRLSCRQKPSLSFSCQCFWLAVKAGWFVFYGLYRGPYRWLQRLRRSVFQ